MPLMLVIDDDRLQRTVAAHALTKAGHEVVEAAGATAGLDLARGRRPDLIICDVQMPGMDGFEFLTTLRREEGISDIPVIMLTAMGDRAHMRTGMTSGADDYLSKPFSFAELTEAVSALLAKRAALQEGLVSSMNTSFTAALEEQREMLASQYERRYIHELSARWDRLGDANSELRYDHAIVLEADLMSALAPKIATTPDPGGLTRRAFQAARDVLHLFSVQHLLPSGNDLLAIFADEPDTVRVRANIRAAKAAFAVRKAVMTVIHGGALPDPDEDAHSDVVLAMQQGPITLVHLSDALHGDPDSTVATGPAVASAVALRDFARSANWRVACSRELAESLGELITVGRNAQVDLTDRSLPPLRAIELLSLR